MLDEAAILALSHGEHGDPFAVLGPHADDEGRFWLRSFQPGAKAVSAIDPGTGKLLAELARRKTREGDSGLFEGTLPARVRKVRSKKTPHTPSALTGGPPAYRLRIDWPRGFQETDDPYRFPPILGEIDVWLLAEGTHLRPFEQLGAHIREIDGVSGTAFTVWAPNALRVSVVGDFNTWDGSRHPMRLRRECGVWEIFLPDVPPGTRYKYEIRARDGHLLTQKADPYAFAAELRPATASIVHPLPSKTERPPANAAESLSSPISIYEAHPASWRRNVSGGLSEFPDWKTLSETLIPYIADLGFTHIELLPIAEHPLDDSWGYQPLGLYAPTARFGPPDGFRNFVTACHAAGIKVIIDWVPGHFPSDAHGLARFDGSALYECADPREGLHPDWGTLIYNFGRREVVNYLVGNALFWIERYGVDGLRVDAVASMLYRDYSRKEGEWIPNVYGGRENIEAIGFLRRLNEAIGRECPWAVVIAEESTAWPAVSRPPWLGGLGFHYKWNMGWMHDVLDYMARDPAHRRWHHNRLTFGLLYAFSENFILPLSHDEVVHGKGSLIGKMSGDYWRKFANLRALYAFMWVYPGKKLLFMGGEFAQWKEWDFAGALDWNLLEFPHHDGIRRLVRDLNALYRATPALHEVDFDPTGFEWISVDDTDNSAIAFLRHTRDRLRAILCVCHFTPLVRHAYRIGVPGPGIYRERINTDSRYYGGSDIGNSFGTVLSNRIPSHGREYSIEITLPPLAALIFEWEP
jgi:1,4-alpha-glucan branching enzyme